MSKRKKKKSYKIPLEHRVAGDGDVFAVISERIKTGRKHIAPPVQVFKSKKDKERERKKNFLRHYDEEVE